MGMFDYVIVEHPIEGVENPAAMEWQTKDFDMPFMNRYKITADGRLLEEIPGSAASFVGCMTSVHDGWRDMNYHGDLNFYGNFGREWLEYSARFTDGQVVQITRHPAQGDRP